MPDGKDQNLEGLVDLYNKQRLYGFLTCLQQKENLADCVTGCLNKGRLGSTHDAKFHSHVRRFPSHREAVLEVANKIKEEEVLKGKIKNFEDLIERINAMYGYADNKKNHVKFFGPLYIYDTAIRIGFHLLKDETKSIGNTEKNIFYVMPDEYVYLQAGALIGAKNLGNVREFNIGKGYLKKVNTNELLTAVPELKKLANLSELKGFLNEGSKELNELEKLITEKKEPTKALLIEDFFCVFEDYLEEAAKK
jgi:hypothetical protein